MFNKCIIIINQTRNILQPFYVISQKRKRKKRAVSRKRFISVEQNTRRCSLCFFYSFHYQSDNNKNTPLVVQSINFNIPSLLRHVFHLLLFSSLPTQLPLLLLHAHHLNSHSSSSSSWLLHSCKDLQTLRQAHASLIVTKGLLPISVTSKLMSLYA